MSDVRLDAERLTIRFTRTEHLLGVVRDFSTPRSAVVDATLVRSWRSEVRGLRVGLGWPGRRLLGTWRSRGHKQLVDLRRDLPAVRLTLSGARYDEVLVSTPDADDLVAALHSSAGGPPGRGSPHVG